MNFLHNGEKLQVEICNPIYASDLVFINQMYVNNTFDKYCEILGEGDHAIVYGYGQYKIKFFKSTAYDVNDGTILAKLQDNSCYPTLYYSVKGEEFQKFVVMEKIDGISLFDLTSEKELSSPTIRPVTDWLKKVKNALFYAIENNIYPEGIHANNVFFDSKGNPYIIDTGSFYFVKKEELHIGDYAVLDSELENLEECYDYIQKQIKVAFAS